MNDLENLKPYFAVYVQRNDETESKHPSGWYTLVADNMSTAMHEAPHLWHDYTVMAIIGPITP